VTAAGESIDPATPVLVGVGVASESCEALELMASAAEAAAADAGSKALLGKLDLVAVPKGNWSYTDPGALLAARFGSAGARTALAELGVPQQTLVSLALSRIAGGEVEVALVVGAEAKRWSTGAARAGLDAPETEQLGAVPDDHFLPHGEIVAPAEVAAAFYDPVAQYATIDSALRASEHLTIGAHCAEIDELWSRFNAVATTNPHAAFPERRDAAALRSTAGGNRPLAFPYNKWHSTQWTVDQAAALLLCSAAAATTLGISRERWIFPHVALESSFALPLSARTDLHAWPAMRVLGEHASTSIGRPLTDVEHVELYSCFPAAVRVQQGALGLPLDGTPTVTGGMAFAGGPFNNFTYQATAAIVERLRAERGSLGMVTTVSGFLTKPGLAVWSSEPPAGGPLIADLAEQAGAATASTPAVAGYAGDGTIAAYTVTFDADAPADVVAIIDTDDGRRAAARCADEKLAARATTEELIGQRVRVDGPVFAA
jgi:acetyl-CoA C-acetyltransferase